MRNAVRMKPRELILDARYVQYTLKESARESAALREYVVRNIVIEFGKVLMYVNQERLLQF
jgi:hypothetical protein